MVVDQGTELVKGEGEGCCLRWTTASKWVERRCLIQTWAL